MARREWEKEGARFAGREKTGGGRVGCGVMGRMNDVSGRALLFFGLDLEFPVILAASRRSGEVRDWSRPGLRIERAPVMASWERETGRTWIGLGRRGLAGALWGEAAEEDLLLPALEAVSLEEGVEACRRALAGAEPFEGGVVLASREGAWACRRGEEGRVLEPGGWIFPAGEGAVPPRVEGDDRVEAALEWLIREEAGEGRDPVRAAALVALAREEIPAGKFLFSPEPPEERSFLDYSNLLERLCGPQV